MQWIFIWWQSTFEKSNALPKKSNYSFYSWEKETARKYSAWNLDPGLEMWIHLVYPLNSTRLVGTQSGKDLGLPWRDSKVDKERYRQGKQPEDWCNSMIGAEATQTDRKWSWKLEKGEIHRAGRDASRAREAGRGIPGGWASRSKGKEELVSVSGNCATRLSVFLSSGRWSMGEEWSGWLVAQGPAWYMERRLDLAVGSQLRLVIQGIAWSECSFRKISLGVTCKINHSKEEKARGRRKDGQITLAEHLVGPSKQLSHLILSTTLNGLYYHPYFTGKDAGVERGEVIFPGLLSQIGTSQSVSDSESS